MLFLYKNTEKLEKEDGGIFINTVLKKTLKVFLIIILGDLAINLKSNFNEDPTKGLFFLSKSNPKI
ncbi:hypothetical protein SAMN02910297_01206 [Methanobrevibacter olleyae]|uniref:Uncharacterized protein n=1 Tax=Methanobrevibacter olleyae TaxID=294671 RepID=A0A1I4INV7_METOL|nr:hypothetical protein SAMN02910297_01206 [Methanobrevibacter olleyae]